MIYESKHSRADIVYLCGAAGCGKGHNAKRLTAHDTRLAVFDVPGDWERARTKIHGNLPALLKVLKRPAFRVAFIPDMHKIKDQFDAFNRMVFAVGRMRCVYDELNIMTAPSWTPASFQNITSRSRHRGLHVVGMSQRPAETGKSIISNASEIFAGRLAEPSDIAPLRARAGRAWADELPNLALRHLKHWQAGQ